MTARMDAAAIQIGDLWSLTAISQKLMPVMADHSPSDTPLYALKNDKVDIAAALVLYHELMEETAMPSDCSKGDLLACKVRKAPSIAGGMAHFFWCLVDIDRRAVIYHFDSLVGTGDPSVQTLAEHSKRMGVVQCSVAEMRIIRATALRRDMQLATELQALSDERLDWRQMPIPVCIPPMRHKQTWPTCTLDVCVVEAAVLSSICVIDPVRLPYSMARATYLHPRQPDGQPENCSYLQFLRSELMWAVAYTRAACVGGKSWPGSPDGTGPNPADLLTCDLLTNLLTC